MKLMEMRRAMVKLGLCPGEHSTEKEARLFATLTVDAAQPTASSSGQQCSHTNADCTLELWTKINLSPLKCLLGGYFIPATGMETNSVVFAET